MSGEKKQDLLFSLWFALEALLPGDTVCTEQSVLIKYQKAEQPIYLRLCHRCINCLHMTFPPPLPFWTIYAMYIPPASKLISTPLPPCQRQEAFLLLLAKKFFFPATCLFGSDCSAGLMVRTRCQLCYGNTVCSSYFTLGGSAVSFLRATVKEKYSKFLLKTYLKELSFKCVILPREEASRGNLSPELCPVRWGVLGSFSALGFEC